MAEKAPKYHNESLDEAAQYALNAVDLGNSYLAGLQDPEVQYAASSKMTSREGNIKETNRLIADPYGSNILRSELRVIQTNGDPLYENGGESSAVEYTADTKYYPAREEGVTSFEHGDRSGRVLPVSVERYVTNGKTGLTEEGAVTSLTGRRAERAREIIDRRNASRIGKRALEGITKFMDKAKFE